MRTATVGLITSSEADSVLEIDAAMLSAGRDSHAGVFTGMFASGGLPMMLLVVAGLLLLLVGALLVVLLLLAGALPVLL